MELLYLCYEDKTVNEIIDHYYRLEPLPYSYNTIYVE
jgi:hypothetical protein